MDIWFIPNVFRGFIAGDFVYFSTCDLVLLGRNTPTYGTSIIVYVVFEAAGSLVFRNHLVLNHVGFELIYCVIICSSFPLF